MARINKNVLFLGGAVTLGLLAAVLSVSYIQERAAAAEAAAASQGTMYQETEVVVLNRDVPAGGTVYASDMVHRMVPVDFVPADVVTVDNHYEYVDRIARGPIRHGTPLSASMLVTGSQQFSRVIAPGRVGYTLSVNENNSISGMITPGDRVDILMTFDGDRGQDNENGAKQGHQVLPLLENIVVLATGARVGEAPGEEHQGFASVTLELRPDQAEVLTIAQQSGSLRVLLRNLEDQTPFGLEGQSERNLFMNHRGAGGASGVEFIIGGR